MKYFGKIIVSAIFHQNIINKQKGRKNVYILNKMKMAEFLILKIL